MSIPSGLALAESEWVLILASLERNQGDKKASAEELGISLKTLYNRLRNYDSKTPDTDPLADVSN